MLLLVQSNFCKLKRKKIVDNKLGLISGRIICVATQFQTFQMQKSVAVLADSVDDFGYDDKNDNNLD